MKRLGLLLVCFATMAFTSCSLFQSAASSNPVAMAAGQTCGTAVQGLYSSYRSSGTVDLTKTNNLNNALALATAYTALKQNKDDQSYRKAFTSGLIASSAGLITSKNASTFVDGLLSAAGLANVNTQNIAQTAATASAVMTLLNTLKQ